MDRPTIAIIGGTGDLGSGLAGRWAAAGYSVVLGSRSREKADAAAAKIGAGVRGDDNLGAAEAGDIVVIAVPYSNHDAILAEIRTRLRARSWSTPRCRSCRQRCRSCSFPRKDLARRSHVASSATGVQGHVRLPQCRREEAARGRPGRLRRARVRRRQGCEGGGDRARTSGRYPGHRRRAALRIRPRPRR